MIYGKYVTVITDLKRSKTIMKTKLILLALTITLTTACRRNKICNCKEEWVINKVYYKNDLAKYHDTCWVAIAQGGGYSPPGPWLQGGQDIWVPCTASNSPKANQ
jgi:hypothetical protein